MDAADIARTAVEAHGANHDIDELTELIAQITPPHPGAVAVEIGCDRGGGLWLLSALGYRVFAITLHTRGDRLFNAHGATVVVGDSTDPAAQDELISLLGGESPALVMVDGGHDAATCRSDVQFAIELVTSGRIVVHDIAAAAYGQDGDVAEVWKVIRGGYSSAEIVAEHGRTPGYGIMEVGNADDSPDAGQRQHGGTARTAVRKPSGSDLRRHHHARFHVGGGRPLGRYRQGSR